ncbi:hypothetical protein [Amycolatopsis sp. NBRC 101858]|uniref:hypothetical protein n=1 Tax=Amycolatopsis sp. NBRC 101858 TaxID=3032200 RepID=UPI002553DD1F|nr:hypothetical protein [Amycolatopsis sp. NBRC 101858]
MLITVLVVALVAGGAVVRWFSSGTPLGSAPSDVASGTFRDIGSGVGVSDDAPEALKAVFDETVVKPPFTETQPLSGVVHVTPDGDLARPATLRFALNRQVDSADVVVAVNRTGKADGWELVAPTKVEGGFAYVSTNHLSWWSPLFRSFGDLADAVVAELKKNFDGLTGEALAEAEKPKCAGENEVRGQGYSITSKGSDPLYWCLGLEAGKPIARVVDKRRYPVMVNHNGFAVTEKPKGRISLLWLAQQYSNDRRTVLLPFDQAALGVQLEKGRSLNLTTEFDGLAESLYQIEFGVTTLVNILTRYGAESGAISNAAIKVKEYDKIAEYTGKILQVSGCTDAVKQDSSDSGAIIAACFSPDALGTAFGWRGVILAAVMVAGPVVNFFRGQFESLRDLLQGRDKETVTVSRGAGTAVAQKDFTNATLPAGVCDSVAPVVLRAGTATVPTKDAGSWIVELLPQAPSLRADVDGDGAENALITVGCTPEGGNASYAEVVVLAGTGTGGLRSLGILLPQKAQPQTYAPAVDKLSYAGGQLTMTELTYAPTDPHCCPTVRATTVWSWRGGKFVVVR